MNGFWTFTHSLSHNGARSQCILQCGRVWAISSCNAGHEVVCLQAMLKKAGLM